MSQDVTILQLGRFGDIINALPIAKLLYDRGHRVHWIVAEEFASILTGVSYVNPIIYHGNLRDIPKAKALAPAGSKLIVTQVYGEGVGWPDVKTCSFVLESFLQAGLTEDDWINLPLVFDRRNYWRENRVAELVHGDVRSNWPLLLVSLEGKSAPLATREKILYHVEQKWGERFFVLDISSLRCEAPYDLLCLYEQARESGGALLTIDTMTLHLAHAVPDLDVIALVPDNKPAWQGCALVSRPQWLAKIPYLELNSDLGMAKIDAALDWIAKGRIEDLVKPEPSPSEPVCVVQLGYFGDIINVLPICHHWHKNGRKVSMVVQREYASVLDGVSYVAPIVFDGRRTDVSDATELARSTHKDVRVLQNDGDVEFMRLASSFARESWRKAGVETLWDDLPLIFDKRNYRRESLMLVGAPARMIVTALSGISSPHPKAGYILHHIRDRFQNECPVVDVSSLRCERIFDLLAFIDRAPVLVSIDSAVLHLGYASRIPTIAFTNDSRTPWHRSAPRKHWLLDVPYSQTTDRMSEVEDAIRGILSPAKEAART